MKPPVVPAAATAASKGSSGAVGKGGAAGGKIPAAASKAKVASGGKGGAAGGTGDEQWEGMSEIKETDLRAQEEEARILSNPAISLAGVRQLLQFLGATFGEGKVLLADAEAEQVGRPALVSLFLSAQAERQAALLAQATAKSQAAVAKGGAAAGGAKGGRATTPMSATTTTAAAKTASSLPAWNEGGGDEVGAERLAWVEDVLSLLVFGGAYWRWEDLEGGGGLLEQCEEAFAESRKASQAGRVGDAKKASQQALKLQRAVECAREILMRQSKEEGKQRGLEETSTIGRIRQMVAPESSSESTSSQIMARSFAPVRGDVFSIPMFIPKDPSIPLSTVINTSPKSRVVNSTSKFSTRSAGRSILGQTGNLLAHELTDGQQLAPTPNATAATKAEAISATSRSASNTSSAANATLGHGMNGIPGTGTLTKKRTKREQELASQRIVGTLYRALPPPTEWQPARRELCAPVKVVKEDEVASRADLVKSMQQMLKDGTAHTVDVNTWNEWELNLKKPGSFIVREVNRKRISDNTRLFNGYI